jgi:hypothetical protein
MTATNINLDGILSQLSLKEKVALTYAESPDVLLAPTVNNIRSPLGKIVNHAS